MKNIIEKWVKKYGYEPSEYELYNHYTDGYLTLSNKEEDAILIYFERKGLI